MTSLEQYRAAYEEAEAENRALRALLRQCEQIIWLMAKQAGGSVKISHGLLADFSREKAVLVYGNDPIEGGTTIEAKEESIADC